MTENEAAILTILADAPWPLRVREFGGTTNSHHTVTASRMVAPGWVRRTRISKARRGPWAYEITPKGVQALANHRALQEGRG